MLVSKCLVVAAVLAGAILTPTSAEATAAPLPPLTSTGAGLRKQAVTVSVPPGWKLTLDGRARDYVDTVLVPQGFYSQDAPAKVVFTPNIGYLGTAAPVAFHLSGPGGQSQAGTYTATVTKPAPPPAPDLTSSGSSRAPQQVGFPLPAGGSHGYVSDQNLNVPQGEFSAAAISGIATVPGKPMDPTLISAEGFLIFTPHRGAGGRVPSIHYRVTDAYGQTSVGLWTPAITGY